MLQHIVVAPNYGECVGLRWARGAMELIAKEIKASYPNLLMSGYTLGHNEDYRILMRSWGVRPVGSIDEVSEGVYFVSAHGDSPSAIAQARRRGVFVINLTCPRVIRNHNVAIAKGKDGVVFIIGKRDHQEMKGYLGIKNISLIPIYSLKDAETTDIPVVAHYAILRQTTLVTGHTSPAEQMFKTLSARINNLNGGGADIKDMMGICSATDFNQNAVRIMCEQHPEIDLVVVIGCKMQSKNTNSLADLASSLGKTPIIVANQHGLIEYKDRVERATTVGITAGASALDIRVIEVIEYLNMLGVRTKITKLKAAATDNDFSEQLLKKIKKEALEALVKYMAQLH